jgi:hypothetical protein
MLRVGLLLVLGVLCIPAPTFAAGDVYLRELIDQAHAAGLAADPEWLALVHYRSNLIFPGMTGQADDPGFYLANDGKTDPGAELDATLRSFFAPAVVETDTVQHPQCRFVARYEWLKHSLHFDPQRLPPQSCERFRKWRATMNASALTLVFPSAYINNPSSMFGHTLLRVDTPNQDEHTRLLAYAVNYAVGSTTDNGMLFTLKSLVGAYPGLFSISPYYVKVKEYSDMENRDIWEYRLNFTQEEIDRLLQHAWELGPTRFDYYFFDENCAYYLLSLFDVARPSLALTDGFRGWVIPVDTVRRVVEQSGLLAGVVYRPANNTRLRDRLARMGGAERQSVIRLAKGEPQAAVLPDLSAAQQAASLEVAYALVRYQDSAGLREHSAAARLSRDLLLARSRLPAGANEIEPPVPAVRPDQGHKTRRLALGLGRRDGRNFQSLAIRPAYNDLLDPSGGYTDGAQINFMDFDLRHYQGSGGVELEKLSLVDIYSLSPRDEFFKPVSWKINTGIARTRLRDGEHVAVYHTNGGAGLALGNWRSAVVYAFVEGALDIGGRLQNNFSLGAGPSVGLIMQPCLSWKLNLFARLQDFVMGDKHSASEVSLTQSFSFGRQHALRLTLSDKRERGVEWHAAALAWHWYF